MWNAPGYFVLFFVFFSKKGPFYTSFNIMLTSNQHFEKTTNMFIIWLRVTTDVLSLSINWPCAYKYEIHWTWGHVSSWIQTLDRQYTTPNLFCPPRQTLLHITDKEKFIFLWADGSRVPDRMHVCYVPRVWCIHF